MNKRRTRTIEPRKKGKATKPATAVGKRNRRVRSTAPTAKATALDPDRSLRERVSGRLESLRSHGARAVEKLRRPASLAARSLAVLVVAAGAIALGRLVERHVRTSPAFSVSEITLNGHVRLDEEEVLSTAGLAIDQNIFDVAPEEASERLTAHPWIAEAEVHRRLPGTYTIEIRERRAVALLALGGVFLVSDDGAVFKPVEESDPIDLPVITGVDRARFTRDRAFRTSVLLEAVALLHDYRGAGLWRREPIAEIHVEPDDGLSLYVGEDTTYVRLGHGPFRAKLRRLRTVLDELGERGARAEYVYLDNERRPDRVTVRIREAPEDLVVEEPPQHEVAGASANAEAT